MKEMDEFQQFAEELEDEEFMDDLEEYDEDIEDEEDTELKISDLTEEELQALQLLQELASVSEKLWNAHIAKLLEYNKSDHVYDNNNRQCGGYRSRSACFGRRKDTETEPGRMRIIIYEGRTKQM